MGKVSDSRHRESATNKPTMENKEPKQLSTATPDNQQSAHDNPTPDNKQKQSPLADTPNNQNQHPTSNSQQPTGNKIQQDQ